MQLKVFCSVLSCERSRKAQKSSLHCFLDQLLTLQNLPLLKPKLEQHNCSLKNYKEGAIVSKLSGVVEEKRAFTRLVRQRKCYFETVYMLHQNQTICLAYAQSTQDTYKLRTFHQGLIPRLKGAGSAWNGQVWPTFILLATTEPCCAEPCCQCIKLWVACVFLHCHWIIVFATHTNVRPCLHQKTFLNLMQNSSQHWKWGQMLQ